MTSHLSSSVRVRVPAPPPSGGGAAGRDASRVDRESVPLRRSNRRHLGRLRFCLPLTVRPASENVRSCTRRLETRGVGGVMNVTNEAAVLPVGLVTTTRAW
jgi:hypothetical protein